MKKILGLVFLMLVFMSAKELTSPKPTTIAGLEGAWELVSHYNYDGEQITDTISLANGYRQIKMYSNGKVMWTRYVPKDEQEWFGYGTYEAEQNSLSETLEYGSASMMKIIDTMRTFSFELQLNADTFSQITLDENGHRTFSENYKRIQ